MLGGDINHGALQLSGSTTTLLRSVNDGHQWTSHFHLVTITRYTKATASRRGQGDLQDLPLTNSLLLKLSRGHPPAENEGKLHIFPSGRIPSRRDRQVVPSQVPPSHQNMVAMGLTIPQLCLRPEDVYNSC
jgi:hypothetical protein